MAQAAELSPKQIRAVALERLAENVKLADCKTGGDLVVALFYHLMLASGFVAQTADEGELKDRLPRGWAENHDVRSFQFKHPRLEHSVTLKFLAMGDTLIISGMDAGDEDVKVLELKWPQYVPKQEFAAAESLLGALSQGRELHALFEDSIVKHLRPAAAPAAAAQQGSDDEDVEEIYGGQPIPQPPIPQPWEPQPQHPLQIGRPRHQGPRFGDVDRGLFPDVGGGHLGGIGGNVIGPENFPGYQGRRRLEEPRFDPYAPFGGPIDPDHDHLPLPRQPQAPDRRPNFGPPGGMGGGGGTGRGGGGFGGGGPPMFF